MAKNFSDQIKIRAALIEEIEADLIGPRNGNTPEERQREETSLSPLHEYFAGVLYPGIWEVADEEKETETGGDSGDEDNPNSNVDVSKLYKPSSFGLTCRLSLETKEIAVKIEYGNYVALKDPETGYSRYIRTPVTESFPIEIKPSEETKFFKSNPNFQINYKIIKTSNGAFLDLYVINNSTPQHKNSFHNIIFQPKITLESVNDEHCFIDDTFDSNVTYDPLEDKHLAILFSNKLSFGKGHLCSVTWNSDDVNKRQASKISTTFVPQETIDSITHRKPSGDIEKSIQMTTLGNCSDKNELSKLLQPLLDEYKNWIDEQQQKVNMPNFLPDDEREIVTRKIEKDARVALSRMQDGLDTLMTDENAFDAFKFANMGIAWQQTMSKWAKQNADQEDVTGTDPLNPDDPRWEKPKWRLFQIAFILMNLESITNPHSTYRETVDLLWFPTGGGKTEAYLGLVAFIVAYRRLRGKNGDNFTDQSFGTAVLMRYTLRLLTVQQFQRAASLMCACEKLRISDKSKWGPIPFQVGLWVGTSVSPNKRDRAKKIKDDLIYKSRTKDLTKITGSNPYVLINCPWCGKKLHPSNGDVWGTPKQWRLFCGRTNCMFSKKDGHGDRSIPVVVTDDDVYARCPSLIIATADKFAQISWRDDVKAIFGKVDRFCEVCGFYDSHLAETKHTHPQEKNKSSNYNMAVKLLPPELIIQDELHLISGPLGTMSGLYETAVDYLCTDDNGIKPKIIASTATTRAARDQIKKLFNRNNTKIFPPQISEFGNTYFSEVDSLVSGKTYIGVLATGKSGLLVIARIAAVILRRIREFESSGKYKQEDLDPYFTLVNYFNSQRELGGASMNFKDSVPHFISRIQHNFENDSNLPQLSKNAKELTISESETESNSVLPEPQIKPNKIRTNQFFGLETEELTSRKNSGEIPQVLRKLEEKITDSEKPTDLLLATNMLAVGVDISRLGVMMVNGQPKNHSEYIQATGRIGRQNPGLIVTIYSYTKPRDLSHYENFKIYHSSYYKNVETVSLTPFTIRCREIALFGVLVGILRMKISRLSKNTDAKYFDPKDEDQMKIINEIKLVFKKRVEDVDPSEQERTMKNIEKLLTRWSKYKKLHGDLLEYREISAPEASKVKKAQKYYLLKSDLTSTRQLIPVPQSLRNAENEQNLFYHQQSEVLD